MSILIEEWIAVLKNFSIIGTIFIVALLASIVVELLRKKRRWRKDGWFAVVSKTRQKSTGARSSKNPCGVVDHTGVSNPP